MEYKVKMIRHGNIYTCDISLGERLITRASAFTQQVARKKALERMSLADFTDFMDWYARHERPWPPAWLVALVAGALAVLVALLVAWSVVR